VKNTILYGRPSGRWSIIVRHEIPARQTIHPDPETHKPNTPVQCYGPDAAAHTKDVVSRAGGKVRLQADPLDTNRDRYGRLLRYVYLPDGSLLDEQIIKEGYGFAYLSFPFSKKDQFAADQQAAQDAKAGLWSACQPTQNQYGGYTSNSL
jgi:endonuclease YncB( thermonuclease family)